MSKNKNQKHLLKTRFIFIVLVCTIILFNLAYAQNLPTNRSVLFSGSGICADCHQPGFPNSRALLDSQGNDVSPVTHWRSTMMGNAAKDPFWQAKVSAEVAAHPELQQVIEDKCTTCHSPLGRTEAHFQGKESYTLEEMNSDALALDGVSCTACHQIKADNLGRPESYSGHYIIENDRLIYGPYQNPFGNPMLMMTGYRPVFGEQTHESELCATCHTLFTPTVDNNGNVVGEAPEQTPYLEWKNSVFPGDDIQCQTCHMPDLDQAVIISSRPMMLGGRQPFAQHHFVGGNVFMLKLLKVHATELGVTASSAHFDSTIDRTKRLLQRETAELTSHYRWSDSDTLVIKVAVKNKSGHKFPTAYPSRRAWLYVDVQNNRGESLFTSGAWDMQTGEIQSLDEPFEKHHDAIRHPEQVQIFQSVMKDVDGKVNYTLLRAAGFIKDNRLPPEGFSTQHLSYDSTAIEGMAASDANFNISNGQQGSGVDTVTYHIGNLDPSGNYKVNVKLLYQSLAPRFVKDLFQYATPEVERFKGYYEQADKSPITIDSLTVAISSTGIKETRKAFPVDPILTQAFPNPFNPTTTIKVETQSAGLVSIKVFDLSGKTIRNITTDTYQNSVEHFTWKAHNNDGTPVASGLYFIQTVFKEQDTGDILHQLQKVTYLK